MKRLPKSNPAARAQTVIDREMRDQEAFEGRAWPIINRLWRSYLRKHRIGLWVALMVTIISSAAHLLFPLTARFLFDDVLAIGRKIDPANLGHHYHLALLYALMTLGIWSIILAASLLSSKQILTVGQKLVFDLRRDLNGKLQQLHISYFERTPTGRIMSRILDDVDMIRKWTTKHLINFFNGTTRLALGTVLSFYLNWKLALLVLATLPFYALLYYRLRPRIRRTNITLRRLNSTLYGRTTERIGGIAVVKAFGCKKTEVRTFAGIVYDYVRVGNRLAFYDQILTLMAGLITATATGAIIYFCALSVKKGEMTIGDLIAFSRVLNQMFDPVRTLTNLATMFQAVLVVLKRIFGLLDEKIDVVPGTRAITSIDGAIHFDNVSFTYPRQATRALAKINLKVRQGERLAIMGPSGSGKTTLLQMLLRFYDPAEGAIYLGTSNLRELDPKSIRGKITLVQQEPFIFSGSLASNIAFGRVDSTRERIQHAAELAELDEFIRSLPDGYDTEVGERGIALSGGQKQRLALAAALLTDPDALLLDDITSALDASTEMRIRETLKRALRGRTSLIITQRIALARDCDRIIMMENGCITAEGTHDELIGKKGFYQVICGKQGWLKEDTVAVGEPSEKQAPLIIGNPS